MKKAKKSIYKKLKKWFKYIFVLPPAILSFIIGVIIYKTSYLFIVISHIIKVIASMFMIEPKMSKSNLKEVLVQFKLMWSEYI
ncbi:MAG: hypothetical protein PHW82_00495 [Bacteroidales bacterium]|nr:hypothetical protein [Bacteroidales bacterium]